MATILVADDERGIRDVLRIMLEALGHEVVEVPDGATALQRASEQPFDVILLDVRMQGVGGYEVLDALRETAGFHTPVIMVTGQSEPDEIMEEAARGAFERVAKPFTIGELERTVQRVLGMSVEERDTRKQSVARRYAIFDSVRKIRSTLDQEDVSHRRGRP